MNVLFRKIRSALIRLRAAVRTICYRSFLAVWQPSISFGRGVQIGRNVRFRVYNGGTITVGDRTALENDVLLHVDGGKIVVGRDGFIGSGTQVVSRQEVSVGNDALIAAYCVIRDFEHGTAINDIPMRKQSVIVAPIFVGDDVWLGAHVVVTSGCRVGSGAVVGANAVVTRDVPQNVIAVGVPARSLRSR